MLRALDRRLPIARRARLGLHLYTIICIIQADGGS
jgi:hypothetical protein